MVYRGWPRLTLKVVILIFVWGVDMHASKNLKRKPSRVLLGGSHRKIVLCGFGLPLAILGAASISIKGKMSEQQADNAAAVSTVEHIDPPSRSATAGPADVPPGIALVTFRGPCDRSQNAPAANSCIITLTRADIDDLMNVLEPAAPAPVRRQLALSYSRLAAAAAASEDSQLSKDPAVVKLIEVQQKLVRMQVLANALYAQVEAHAAALSPAEIEEYYAAHQSDFVHGDVLRLTIPKTISAEAKPDDVVALRTLAESYRTRAAKGENIDHLQQEVLDNLGLKMKLPPSRINMPRPSTLSVAERPVFELQPGAVTELIETASAFMFLKLESKQPIPLDIAKPEIVAILQHDRAQEAMRKATAAVDAQFNLKYFGLATAPEILPPPQIAGLAASQNLQSSAAPRMPISRPLARARKR
jgi:PPIC-type PPIASE domain